MNLLRISKNANENNKLKDILEETDGTTGDRRF